MTTEEFMSKLLSAAVEAGIAEAEAYYASHDSMNIRVFEGQLDQYAVNTRGGLSLRGLVGGKMGTAYTEALDEEAIDMLIRSVKESAALIEDEDEQFIFEGSPKYETVETCGKPVEADKAIDFAMELDRLGRSLDERVQKLAGVAFSAGSSKVMIHNTKGLRLSGEDSIAYSYLSAVAREGQRTASGMDMDGGYDMENMNAEDMARRAVDEAVFMLSAKPCASGTYKVILRNTAMAQLLETFASIFSAEAAQKGLSLLNGREGEEIAASCVTLRDDPLLPGGFATQAFDGEGVATYSKNVIENGKLVTLLHNLKTAKKAGVSSTGNGARAGYMSGVSVAPTNFFIVPGEKDLDTLCREMGEGLVITDVSGLHAGANPASGDFSLLSQGYLVKNGLKADAVEQITIAGNIYELFKTVAEVGSDLKFPLSNVGCPSVLISKLSVAGV